MTSRATEADLLVGDHQILSLWPWNAASGESRPRTKGPSMPASILIIDDYTAHLELVRYLLEHDGHEPVTAMTGEHAIEVLARVTPDLILCDLHLGSGMDGYTVAEWARTHPRLAACPMLCMTAFFGDFDADRAQRCGFLTVVPKPISAETFVVQIEYYLPAEKRMVLRPRLL
jgi:two-component system, cell cycle response regulator DivK